MNERGEERKVREKEEKEKRSNEWKKRTKNVSE